jgi:hypothetical protein
VCHTWSIESKQPREPTLSTTPSVSATEPAGLTLLFAENAAQAVTLGSTAAPPKYRPFAPSVALARASAIVNLSAFRDAKVNDLDVDDLHLMRAHRNIAAIGEVVTWGVLKRMTGLPLEEIKTRCARLQSLGHIRYVTPSAKADDATAADNMAIITHAMNNAHTHDILSLIVVKHREWIKAQSDELREVANATFKRCKARITAAEAKATKPKSRKPKASK